MIKQILFKALKGKLADSGLLLFLVDLLTNLPEMGATFVTASGGEISAVGVVGAIGYLWGVARRLSATYQYDY